MPPVFVKLKGYVQYSISCILLSLDMFVYFKSVDEKFSLTINKKYQQMVFKKHVFLFKIYQKDMKNHTKELKIKAFAPDDVLSEDMNIFGMPFTEEEADIILLPVPWDVTVSYKDGTANAPKSIKKAAVQIEIYDADFENAWHTGFFMCDIDKFWLEKNKEIRSLAKEHIKAISSNKPFYDKKRIAHINNACIKLHEWVEEKSTAFLDKGKIVAVVGGDHSSPFGLIKALSNKYEKFSVLQIDAHADLRNAYEGFEYSHASVMFNALKIKNISRLVQVGIRDFGKNEKVLMQQNQNRIVTFFDNEVKEQLFNKKCWADIVKDVISHLDENVYVSFDIDGLSPELCPNTGTPVPGGLDFNKVVFLIKALVKSNKKIIGFDLCEVGISENEWDECVASRILYKLCCATAVSNALV